MYAGTPKRLPPVASGLESKIEDENDDEDEDDYGKDCEKRALSARVLVRIALIS